MTRCALRAGRLAAGLALAALLVAGAGPTAADAEVEYASPAVQEAWKERLAEARARLERSRARYRELVERYQEARDDDHPRGEAFQAIVEQRDAALRAWREARRALPALAEEARRAGVLPEVLRPTWEVLDELEERPEPPALD